MKSESRWSSSVGGNLPNLIHTAKLQKKSCYISQLFRLVFLEDYTMTSLRWLSLGRKFIINLLLHHIGLHSSLGQMWNTTCTFWCTGRHHPPQTVKAAMMLHRFLSVHRKEKALLMDADNGFFGEVNVGKFYGGWATSIGICFCAMAGKKAGKAWLTSIEIGDL